MKNSILTHRNKSTMKSLPYDIVYDDETYHIVFNLPNAPSTHLYCSLNKIDRKVIVILNDSNHSSTVHYPCIFRAPADANLDEVRIHSRDSVHMVSIPKTRRESRTACRNDSFQLN